MMIAFHNMVNSQWPAGSEVLRLLACALRSLEQKRPSMALTVWDNQAPETYAEIARLFDKVIRLPSKHEGTAITDTLVHHNVDCFFSIPIQSVLDISIPRITWFYDFQHIHYPGNFTSEENARRSEIFHRNALSTTIALTYSENVAQDFRTLWPALADKLSIIRFVPSIPAEAFARQTNVRQINGSGLPERYFFLPNNFQPHKNHKLVVEALQLLASDNCFPHIVCTGYSADKASASFLAELAKAGQSNQWHCMGMVPRPYYYKLMQHSVALLNPSLFEGFGLGVAEAKYLRRKTLLSDLPVFREHKHPEAFYFNPHSAADLAASIKSLWQSADESSESHDPQDQYEAYRCDQKVFGAKFLQLFEKARN